jgi:hypothetical protein
MRLIKLIRRACAVLGLVGLFLAGWIAVNNLDSPPLFAEMAYLWALILVIASGIPFLLWWYLKLPGSGKRGAPRP